MPEAERDLTLTLTQGWIQFEFEITPELSKRLERAVVTTGLSAGEIWELGFHDDPYAEVEPATRDADYPPGAVEGDLESYEAARGEWARRILSRGIDLARENHQTDPRLAEEVPR